MKGDSALLLSAMLVAASPPFACLAFLANPVLARTQAC